MTSVFVFTKIGEKNIKRINDEGAQVLDGAGLCSGVSGKLTEPVDGPDKKKFDELLSKADIVYGHSVPANVISRAPRLKWIQTMLAGTNTILTPAVVQSTVIVTNSKGIHMIPGGELALTLMLDLAKQMPAYYEKKHKREYFRTVQPPALLNSQTVGILGLGNIGRGVARMSKGFGMRVIATRRTVKQPTPARWVDMVYPADQSLKVMAESDFVVNCLPLTPETTRIIGEKQIRAMKSTAFFINVGRGATVDEPVLIKALEEGWIAGAGLDTFDKEPLAAESRMWGLSNVIITPHIAGQMVQYHDMATDLFMENLKRFLNGKKLHNIVDKNRGY